MADLRSMSDEALIARYQATRPLSSLSNDELVARYQDVRRVNGIAALRKENPAEYDPQSPEFRTKYGAAGTDFQNFAAGAGKAVVDTGRGLEQIGTNLGHAAGIVSDETQQAVQAAIDQSRINDADLMATKAGIGGSVAGNLAITAIPASMAARAAQGANLVRTAAVARALANPGTYRAAAAGGAALGALQPVATGESRLSNAAIGGATGAMGQGVARAAGRIAQPVKTALTGAASKAAQTLQEAGVPLDLAQRTGSKLASRIRAALSDNPITAGDQAAFVAQQQSAYNRAVLATIGENADAATPNVLARAQQRIGAIFDDIAARNPVKYDKSLEVGLTQIEADARRELGDDAFGVIRRQLDEILQKAADGNGAIDGRAYQNIKTGLDRISMGQDQSKGNFARLIREQLDKALQRSASGDDVQVLKTARAQYRRLKQIEPAVATDESGNISAAKLANQFGTKKNAAQGKYGRGDQVLPQLARAGKEILPERLPNSGTAPRIAAQLLVPAAIGSIGGFSSGEGFDPETALKFGLGAYAIPKLAGRAIAPGGLGNYLAGGITNPYARGALMLPQRLALPNVAASSALALRREEVQ